MHCLEKEGVRSIVLLQVEDGQTDQVQLNLLQTNIYSLLQCLSSGSYKHYIEGREDKITDLMTEYDVDTVAKLKARYSFHLSDNIGWKVERVKYSSLQQYISKLARSKDSIVDVTAVSKGLIGDIFACCLLKNIKELRTFELLINPNYVKPWKTLVHELELGQSYQYTNLVERPVFKDCTKAVLIRTMPLLISVVGTALFLALTLLGAFIFGFSGIFAQVISVIGTVLGIVSFLLIYFPVRGK